MTLPPDATTVDLDLHERIEAAMTPGPWKAGVDEPDSITCDHCPVAVAVMIGIAPDDRPAIYWTTADRDGVILLRNDHAAMVAELRAAREQLQALTIREHNLATLANLMLASVKASYMLFTPEFRAQERLMEPAAAAEVFAEWQRIIDGEAAP